ncbi:MAG: 23S rRNA (pseudouridine(1915)-N(3))-methyltransferase RlmH [Myxococcota bacterium]
MRFRVLIVGRSRCRWADEAVDDYTRRIRRYGGVEQVDLKAEPFRGDVEAVRRAEAARIVARVGERDRLVVLDERGDRLDTAGFAAAVDAGRQSGAVVFAIGGPYGHGAAARDAAWRVVRLSDLVLNHEVARVVLYEQLYRALTVLEGAPYHH